MYQTQQPPMLLRALRLSVSVLAFAAFAVLVQCAPVVVTSVDSVRSITFYTVGRIPVIEARLNGKPARFIIDTGASVSVLNTREAGFYGFAIRPNDADAVDVTGFSGQSQLQGAGQCMVEIGSLRITHLRFRSRDMHDFARVLYPAGDARIAGILGSDVLMQYKMKIDFTDRKVFF